ncbi:MAG: protein kinase family protein [Bacteroidia bacterium]|nr:protein kinase family protein [Bacteroidia bacterium]
MKLNEIINGYRILQDFQTAGGGLSKWSFAERNGEEYFIKEFLHPTFPLADSPGSARVKARKREECEKFEAHQQALKSAMDSKTIPGGNLIAALDFFRYGAKYFKVTDKVDMTALKPAQIASLPLSQRILIMTTTAHSLRILHSLNIVHGDLKLDNVLIKKTRMGSYTTKLIDFDSSYFNQKPPTLVENVVGDMVFYSPELARYIRQEPGVKPEDLTVKSDIFALGLLYSLYLSGRLPNFDLSKYKYAWIWVLQGHTLEINNPDLPGELKELLEAMLAPKAEARPDIETVFLELRKMVTKPAPLPEAPQAEMPRKIEPKKVHNPNPLPLIGTELKGKMVDLADVPTVLPAEDEGRLEERFVEKRGSDDSSPGLGGLRGTLLGGKK